MTTNRVELSRVVAAPLNRVFEALTTPALMAQWVCPGEAKSGVIQCSPTVGGSYSIEMKLPDGNAVTVSGRYVDVVANRRLVYTWKWAHETEESQVTITLSPLGDGTEVRLVHELVTTEASRDGHTQGWEACLTKLAAMFV